MSVTVLGFGLFFATWEYVAFSKLIGVGFN
jgi:hypothetical protein